MESLFKTQKNLVMKMVLSASSSLLLLSLWMTVIPVFCFLNRNRSISGTVIRLPNSGTMGLPQKQNYFKLTHKSMTKRFSNRNTYSNDSRLSTRIFSNWQEEYNRKNDIISKNQNKIDDTKQLKMPFYSPSFFNIDKMSNNDSKDKEMQLLERQVIASANAKLDEKRIKNAVLSNNQNVDENESKHLEEPPSSWNVAIAAGAVAFAVLNALLPLPFYDSLLFSGVGSIVVFAMAMTKYEDTDDDNVAGPIARMLGRATLSTYKKAQPKVKAVARAVVAKDDYELLIKQLQTENSELKEWKRRRIAVDEAYSDFTMNELKNLARQNQIQGFSTMNKSALMMKLVEAKALDL